MLSASTSRQLLFTRPLQAAACCLISLAILLPACGHVGKRAGRDDNSSGSGGTAQGGAAAGGHSNEALRPSASCKHPPVQENCVDGLCRIERGCFVMGAPPAEWGRGARSTRQVEVTLTRSFEIGSTELTRQQWQDAGFAQPVQHAQHGTADCLSLDCPQGDISFFDALSFANRYSALRSLEPCYELEGCRGQVGNGLACASVRTTSDTVYACKGYRLPTEAEWEYAARAGATTPFYTGEITTQPDPDCYSDSNMLSIGWYCFNSGLKAHPVAMKQKNAWGLFDASGNVHEWCNDVYKPGGYGSGPLVDPTGMLGLPADLTLDPSVDYRISRSGDYLMPAFASKNNWHTSFSDGSYGANLGMRLARTLQETP